MGIWFFFRANSIAFLCSFPSANLDWISSVLYMSWHNHLWVAKFNSCGPQEIGNFCLQMQHFLKFMMLFQKIDWQEVGFFFVDLVWRKIFVWVNFSLKNDNFCVFWRNFCIKTRFKILWSPWPRKSRSELLWVALSSFVDIMCTYSIEYYCRHHVHKWYWILL